ncbi:MAG: 2-amino-4-hydroxy-6-hydroxymethyldihydropteridine diphosphokinase [Emcibacteraceae bacterium]|nr:2-amino-4-hydroxy-6-hydroxymethyldihydropteridine diphosphokinase [Emcibacteraceae bacterium]
MILIGLGSNLTTEEYATSKEILEAAIVQLNENNIVVRKKSSFYETEPVPKSDQPWFVNAVVQVDTNLNAIDLLKRLHEIEHDLGRVRRERWEARIIDLDLLCYNNDIYPSKDQWAKVRKDIGPSFTVIPHGRLHERDFVLIPMRDIAPDWMHPIFEKTTENMLDQLVSVGIVRKML